MAQQSEGGREKRASRSSGKTKAAEIPSGHTERSNEIPPVVGVGASAGSLEPYRDFVQNVPEVSGVAWVLIQHMAPDRESHLSQILGRATGLSVIEVTEDTKIEPDRIYVIAPGQTMTVRDGMLRTVTDTEPLARRTSIDAFFLSLAEALGPRSGCALLSGAGTDGTIGLKAVKEAGGLTLTQTLDTAQYDSMLLSAVRTGLVDREMAVGEMPRAFVDFLIERLPAIDGQVGDGERSEIVSALRKAVGHDFSGYKHSTFDRRVRRRMVMLGVDEFPDYLEHLREDREEGPKLFRDLLIGVTRFFRDPEAFAALAEKAIPDILKGKTADHEIRVWSAGCATGEEAYSLAILLHEQASQLDSVPEIRVFGSDIDENALHVARMGRYPKGIEADVSPERLERYFEREDGTWCIRGELRDMCLFAQHNMLRDPSFSRVDLLSCRNTLIYMNAELQKLVIPVFHYALKRDGFLFLGPAENAAQPVKLFREVDRTYRIFRRTGEVARLPEFPLAAGDGHERPHPTPAHEMPGREAEDLRTRTARRVLEGYAPPYVVVDSDLEILESSGRTGDYLELPSGRPRINLSAMARSGLAVDVRAALGKTMATGEPITRRGLVVSADGENRHVTLVVERLAGESRDNAHYLVVFQPEPERGEERIERPASVEDEEVVRALEQELTNTKERLQTALEELETSNEELKAANEDLSSVNEELQSSNEELETSREELQSINEELRTVNNELNSRVDELSRANNDLKNLFANTEIAMLFLDDKFRVLNFTPPAKPLFHLRDHDLGRPLDELAGRVDHLELKEEMEEVIKDGEQREREVQTNSDDPRTFIMRMLPYRDTDDRIKGAVLTFIDITERKRSEERLARMISELNHRVKNALASVQSIISFTARSSSSVEEFEERLLGRVQAMAAGHNLISEADWQHAEFEELARAILEPFTEGASDRLTVSGPRVRLSSSATVPVAMILHELATNAAKYGAWSASGGKVSLGWRLGEARRLRLTWTESGGARVQEPKEPGFGLQFIRQSTEYDLDGDCTYAFDRDGFSCTLDLPTTEVVASPEPDSGRAAR